MKLALVYTGAGTFYGQPMGLLFLAAWLKRHAPQWTVRIVDANWEDPLDVLLREPWDVCGITAMTGQYENASKLAKFLRAAHLGPVLIGGVHISTCPTAMRPEFDAAFYGEGEMKLAAYLNGQPSPAGIVSLQDYPDLDYSLLDNRYFVRRPIRAWQDSVVEAMLITSRGCPYSCRFCSTTQFWQKYRPHETEWVIRQLRHLAGLGVTHVQIYDDLFALSHQRLKELAEAFEREGLHRVIKGMSGMSRANLIDDEMCDYLRRLNFRRISFGFESGSDRVLRYLKRTGASMAINKRAMLTARRNKLACVGSLMLGNPTETATDMLRTTWFILWAWWHGVEDLWPFVLTPYPGTEFWQLAKERGVVSDNMADWNKLTIRSKIVGEALLCDIPRWQFVLIWYLTQLVLLPFKVRKAFNLIWSWRK